MVRLRTEQLIDLLVADLRPVVPGENRSPARRRRKSDQPQAEGSASGPDAAWDHQSRIRKPDDGT
jgi:hypothetical protein